LTSALTASRTQHAAIQATLARLERALDNDGEISSVPQFRNAPLIQDLRTEESALLSRAVQLEETVGADHPSLRRVTVQLAEVRRKMASEAEQITLSVQLERDALSELMAQLSADVRDLEQKALAQGADEIELRQLEREAQAARLLYENFLNRLQETSQQETLQTADARIISPAEVPNTALSGSRNRTLALGALLGGLVGLGIVFLLQRLNNTFRAVPQLEESVGLSVLASVPIVKRKMHRRDVIDFFRSKPNSSLAEAVRNLRTSILFSNVDNPPKAIMVTSSIPREGKSTTATLIALTSQQMGRSAILVDCDLRLPALANILQFDKDKPGILSLSLIHISEPTRPY